MAVADAELQPIHMHGERDREDDELEGTGSIRRRYREEAPPPPPPAQHPVKDIVLPLAVVIGLIGNAWWGGVGWGKVSTQLEQILATLNTTVTTVSAHDKAISQLEARIKAQEENLRLFKMYTKGRIARLPYRASDDGE